MANEYAKYCNKMDSFYKADYIVELEKAANVHNGTDT
jgi:hypothetical protein